MDLRTIAFWAFWGPLTLVGGACYAVAILTLLALALSVPVGFLLLVF